MLLYLNSCAGEYRLSDGRIIKAPKGSVIYAPYGAKYHFKALEQDKNTFSSIILNFRLKDEDGEYFVLSEDDITVIEDGGDGKIGRLFLDFASEYAQNVRSNAAMKKHLYKILSELCGHYHRKIILSPRFKVISKGIFYLEESDSPDLSVKELAEMCNVSEIYFRKLFKEYSGISPTQFKTEKLIMRAKQCLASEGKSIQETAYSLGFSDIAYFCRVFKKKVGMTAGEWAKRGFRA